MSKIFSRRRLAMAILLTVVFYICMATSFDPSDRYSHMQNPLVTLLIYLLYVTAFCTIDIRDCMILSRFSNPQAAIRYYIGKTAGYVSACFAVDFVVMALLSLLLRPQQPDTVSFLFCFHLDQPAVFNIAVLYPKRVVLSSMGENHCLQRYCRLLWVQFRGLLCCRPSFLQYDEWLHPFHLFAAADGYSRLLVPGLLSVCHTP